MSTQGLGQPARGRHRDRRGRGARGPLAWPPVPAMRSPRQHFDSLVIDAAERARPYLGARHVEVDFAVEEVPPDEPGPWGTEAPALGRLVGGGRRGQRIVLYRRPIEARALDRHDLPTLVRAVVAEQIALLIGIPPDEVTL